MAITVVIFEDNEDLRKSLITLFQYGKEYVLKGIYENALSAKEVMKKDAPDIVLLDIDMPGMNGIKAIPVIKEANPLTAIIMYTQFEDDEKLFKSLCAGANGYILKSTSPLKLFDAIDDVREGGMPLSPAVAKKVLNHFREKDAPKKEYGLTDREKEVLKLLVKGYTVKLIASELNIAFDTSRSHLRNIYHKLHVNCGKEAIAKILGARIKL